MVSVWSDGRTSAPAIKVKTNFSSDDAERADESRNCEADGDETGDVSVACIAGAAVTIVRRVRHGYLLIEWACCPAPMKRRLRAERFVS
jgi:hypothetical protein